MVTLSLKTGKLPSSPEHNKSGCDQRDEDDGHLAHTADGVRSIGAAFGRRSIRRGVSVAICVSICASASVAVCVAVGGAAGGVGGDGRVAAAAEVVRARANLRSGNVEE